MNDIDRQLDDAVADAPVTETVMSTPLAPSYRRFHAADYGKALSFGPLLARSGYGYRHHLPRWHRPRSGLQYPGRTSWRYWCGQGSVSGRIVFADQLPAGDMVCGTCEGRAMGAGWPSSVGADALAAMLTFTPPALEPPTVCPGSPNLPDTRPMFEDLPGGRAARCLYCGHVDRVKGGSRGGYGWTEPNVGRHTPANLVEPCPEHGWTSMVHGVGRLVCRCIGREVSQ